MICNPKPAIIDHFGKETQSVHLGRVGVSMQTRSAPEVFSPSPSIGEGTEESSFRPCVDLVSRLIPQSGTLSAEGRGPQGF